MKRLTAILCLFVLVSTACAIATDDSKGGDKKAVATDDTKGGDDEAGMKAVDTLVKTAVNKVLVVLKKKDLSHLEKREQVMKIIKPLVDFELMAYLSTPKSVRKTMDAKQKAAFKKLYVETVKRSYIEKLDLFTDETVEFGEPVRGTAKTKYSMVTHIVSRGDRVEVDYYVAKRKDGWKIYDFKIEGVSLRRSYLAQYTDYLNSGKTIDDLLELMQRKIDELEKKEPKDKPKKKDEGKKRN